MSYIFKGYITIWFIILFIIPLVLFFIKPFKNLKKQVTLLEELKSKSKKKCKRSNNERRLEKNINSLSKKYFKSIFIYIVSAGFIILIFSPIIYIKYIYNLKISLNIDILTFLNKRCVIASLVSNALLYYLFLNWYLQIIINSNSISNKIDKINLILTGLPKIFFKILIIPLFMLTIMYLELNLLNILNRYSNNNIYLVILLLFIYLIIVKLLAFITTFILNHIFKNKDFLLLKQTINLLALVVLLYLYVYGNTKELSSTTLTLALTSTLTIYGVLDKLSEHIKKIVKWILK